MEGGDPEPRGRTISLAQTAGRSPWRWSPGWPPWAELIVSRGWWQKRDVGWWGADDRAHDRWMGRDMLIAGVPSLSPEAAEDLYRADRALALAAGAPGEDWPDWTPERVERDGRMVSASPAIQAWDDDRVAGHVAQGIGRCRPLDHPACEILLLGPRISLEDHGITVVELDSGGVSGTTERRQLARLGRLLRLAEAAVRLEDRGQSGTEGHPSGAAGRRGRRTIRPLLGTARRDGPGGHCP